MFRRTFVFQSRVGASVSMWLLSRYNSHRDGQIHGGQIHGGQIHGGQIHGGQIHGGQIHGGQIHVGQIHGGQIHGGQILEIFGHVPKILSMKIIIQNIYNTVLANNTHFRNTTKARNII